MKKLLYITANSKPEEMSSSKTVGRRLVNAVMSKIPDIKLEEVDLYKEHIPQLKYCYFESRNTIISPEARSKLSLEEQREVDQIIRLCDQFIGADIYVMAAPMWSLSFPAPVKEYIDCVVQAEKTIAFKNKRPYGLLNDKKRVFIYVQSSGGKIPWIIRPALNKGLNYVHDVMKFIGIERFEELLADGTGLTEDERREAIEKATDEIDGLAESISF
jgi:FMN-dependent NADH-azoreductase